MKNLFLLNKLLDVTEVLALNPNGFGSAKEEYAKVLKSYDELKKEVLDIMNK